MDFMYILAILVGILALVVVYFAFSYIGLWIQALVSGAKVGLFNIIFMRFRKVPPKLIVTSKIMAVKAGIDIATDNLESHYLPVCQPHHCLFDEYNCCVYPQRSQLHLERRETQNKRVNRLRSLPMRLRCCRPSSRPYSLSNVW